MIHLSNTRLLCSTCADHEIIATIPLDEDRARRHLHLVFGGTLQSIAGHELVMRHEPEALEEITCSGCGVELAPAVRECESCREFMPWESGPYCEECSRSARSVAESDWQTAVRMGTAGGHL